MYACTYFMYLTCKYIFKLCICLSALCVCMCVCVCVLSPTQTLCNAMDCSPPGSSVHGISQARILEFVVMPSPRGWSQTSNWTRVSYVFCTGRRVLLPLSHLGSPCICTGMHICTSLYIHMHLNMCINAYWCVYLTFISHKYHPLCIHVSD